MLFAKILALLMAGMMEPDGYEDALTAAVHHFASEGDLGHIKAILERHPRLVDSRETFDGPHKPHGDEGYTPLARAADHGHADVATYLIGAGAKVNAADGAGWTPLHLAARAGHLEVVKLLVQHGADVSAKTDRVPETTSDALPGSPPRVPGEKAAPVVKYGPVPARTALEWAEALGHRDVAANLRSLRR
ncbi:Ankyrin repeat protein [Aquisphaera giovannonii]|uniref:Ankyrin repeat protein n=1 Tax=Aquisphaera giovannonii TaxID=406548 RepID=A0A5B9W0W5_9BACT|nr:ankyrin repeat domain-containing protein [Aquisphaera giovannonii]QEH34183.1 Ankyrin repeat protein [Aquisphaera giovannonii]